MENGKAFYREKRESGSCEEKTMKEVFENLEGSGRIRFYGRRRYFACVQKSVIYVGSGYSQKRKLSVSLRSANHHHTDLIQWPTILFTATINYFKMFILSF